MKLENIKIIACPNCLNSPLEKELFEQNSDEIIEGNLYCSICKEKFPIEDGIPRMLPGISKFDKKHQEVIKANLKYHDIAAETYEYDVEEAMHQNEFNQKRIEKIIKELSKKTENSYFLDAGCGTGNLLKYGKNYFKKAIGIDVSINMLKIAKERGYEVLQADALCLPFKPNVFNAVSIFSVLHHLYDYEFFFSGASRVLKSGGFLYTDWDPLRQPKIDETKISWQIFKLIRFFGKPLKNFLSKAKKPKGINLRDIKPELRNLYDLAEYHNLALKEEERGIDANQLEKILVQNGFTDIQSTFHWAGKSRNQLPISLKMRFFFLKFQKQSLEHFMENIMMIAKKK